MSDPGLTRCAASAMASAVVSLAAGGASAWVITEDDSLRAKARAGAAIVYSSPIPERGPAVFVLHEAEGLCTPGATGPGGAATDDAVSRRTIQPADGARRGRITIDADRAIGGNGLIAAELARAIDAIDPLRGDRLASVAATTILSSIPFQPPDTGGTEWTKVAFGIAGPVGLQGSAPPESNPWNLVKQLAKSMMLPAAAIVVTIALLWVGLRRLRPAEVT